MSLPNISASKAAWSLCMVQQSIRLMKAFQTSVNKMYVPASPSPTRRFEQEREAKADVSSTHA